MVEWKEFKIGANLELWKRFTYRIVALTVFLTPRIYIFTDLQYIRYQKTDRLYQKIRISRDRYTHLKIKSRNLAIFENEKNIERY